MSATDELRKMLDERGVEYRTHGTTDRTWFEVGHTSWFIFERENGNFTVDAVFLTPEQAIAATLGAGMCHEVVDRSKNWYTTVCSECGFTLAVEQYGPNNFCPNCGRRIEVEE